MQLFGFLMGAAAPSDGISKKLTNVEAQRIMAVMDEMLRKSQLMCWVPTLIKHIKIFAPRIADDIVHALEEYSDATKRLKNVRPESSEAIQATKELQACTRNLLREIFNDVPSYDYIQSKMANEKGDKQSADFHASLKDLKLLLFERLLTTVEQQKARSDHLAYIIDKERRASEEVDRLTEELNHFEKARQEEFDKHQVVLSQLNREINDIKSKTSKQERRIIDTTAQSQETEKKDFKTDVVEIESKKKALEEKLKSQREEHKAEELSLRRRKWKIESEVRAWITKYDDEMGQKQEELEDLTSIYDDEKDQQSELKKRHDELKVEYDRIEEERRIQKDAMLRLENDLRVMVNAAQLIQAIWRGFRTRRSLKQKLKKLQGKGSAKKKKK